MTSLEASFEKACQDGTIPGAVLMASDRTGAFNYAQAFGVRSLATKQPMTLDTIMFTASCTKLLTTIAALQCVERGLVTLDEDTSARLPELGSQKILTGFDEAGEPVLLDRKNPITLRHLLTHSAGLIYEMMSPLLQRYRPSASAHRFDRTLVTDMATPLLYEPGTGWLYGTSIDWAGKLVERITGKTLEEYMSTNIWGKLGITDITFWPKSKAGIAERTAGMSVRDGKTGSLTHEMESIESTPGAKDCFGGHGSYASMPSFMKVLQSLLRDDEVLLKQETTRMMFEPQLTEESREAMRVLWDDEANTRVFVGEFPAQVRKDWGLGGLLVRDGTEGWRRRNTLVWSGMPNLLWFIDREAGLCGLYGVQVKPPGDVPVGKMITLFEKAMYERFEAGKARI